MFGEYLKTVAEYYEKGYLSQDLYTIDNETTRALMQNGKIRIWPVVVYLLRTQ
ncbi:MAG: hypothetical protein ACLR23_02420 [Clostridia bacterium]